MFISKDWSILRVTLLLYILVALFPVNIYFANHLLTDTQLDTATIKDLKKVSGYIQDVSMNMEAADSGDMRQIDQLLETINREYMLGDSNAFDIGFENVQVEYATLKGCWGAFKSEITAKSSRDALLERSAACQKTVLKLMVLVDKMANIKRERALLRLNITLIFTMIIMVLTIYYVRTSMKMQLERHTIYDVETKLFNRDYFDAEIKKACALAVRKQHPLALIAIAIDNYETTIEPLSKNKYDQVMGMLGGLFLSMTRTSDTSCRYEAGEFVIIAPETALKDAVMVSQRIHKRIIEHDFLIQHPITVSICVALQHENEEVANLIKRTMKTLQDARKEGNTIVTADVKL